MERLFTSITNAEESAKRIKNDLHTGYYAGEREDYMMNGINMTEKGLIKENVPVKVALDHGWSSIKGEHIFMETSVVPVDYTPLTNHGLLEYKGQKYIIGQGRLGKQATKTENDNYFLLTLVGIAKELQCQGNEQAEHVELYAGVPITLFGAERKEFRNYLWHKERISFTFEGVCYSFFMDKVKIYAQCYAAIANRMGDMDRLRCVDLGSWTMDVLSVRERIPMDKDGTNGTVSIGEAAHICAASPGGKRYDNSMSPEQRSSYENGIWLCRNCAAMIDRDEDYYTVDMLHMWKQLAELEASKNIMGRGSCEEQIALSNNDRCVIDNIIQVVEMGNTSYMLKDFDYHNDFQRDLLSPLFSLMEYLQQPSTKICNFQLREKVQELVEIIDEFRWIIALKGGPAKYGNGSYIIDFKEDQDAANDICTKIWERYVILVNTYRMFD